jgi:hypothetical protein
MKSRTVIGLNVSMEDCPTRLMFMAIHQRGGELTQYLDNEVRRVITFPPNSFSMANFAFKSYLASFRTSRHLPLHDQCTVSDSPYHNAPCISECDPTAKDPDRYTPRYADDEAPSTPQSHGVRRCDSACFFAADRLSFSSQRT